MYQLNYGPHHPSTHGVLRLLLTMDGEQVIKCKPIIGYLHRNVEKLCENKPYISIISYIDRLDYLAPVISEHAYVLALEELKQIKPSRRTVIIRTIFDELTRISCHIMGIGCATWDMGSLSLFLYGIQEREKIMDIFKSVTGHRMHLTYYVPGGVLHDLTDDNIKQIIKFCENIGFYLEAVEKLALNNIIFKLRTKKHGIITQKLATNYGISGVNLRATGINYDIRKVNTYGMYNELNFEPITLDLSDCYNRTFLRYLEIKQSIKLILNCIKLLKDTMYQDAEHQDTQYQDTKYLKIQNFYNLRFDEQIIIYRAVENSRGEFGIHMITGATMPKRIHFKSPSFAIIQMLSELLINQTLADISMILGSLDFIMGDCDR